MQVVERKSRRSLPHSSHSSNRGARSVGRRTLNDTTTRMHSRSAEVAVTESAIREQEEDVTEATDDSGSGLYAIELRPIANLSMQAGLATPGSNSAPISRSSPDFYFAAAWELRSAGRFKDAISQLSIGIRRYPNDFRLAFNRGYLHYKVAAFGHALQDFLRAYEILQQSEHTAWMVTRKEHDTTSRELATRPASAAKHDSGSSEQQTAGRPKGSSSSTLEIVHTSRPSAHGGLRPQRIGCPPTTARPHMVQESRRIPADAVASAATTTSAGVIDSRNAHRITHIVVLHNVALALLRLHRPMEGVPYLDKAVEHVLSHEHHKFASLLHMRAILYRMSGDFLRAVQDYVDARRHGAIVEEERRMVAFEEAASHRPNHEDASLLSPAALPLTAVAKARPAAASATLTEASKLAAAAREGHEPALSASGMGARLCHWPTSSASLPRIAHEAANSGACPGFSDAAQGLMSGTAAGVSETTSTMQSTGGPKLLVRTRTLRRVHSGVDPDAGSTPAPVGDDGVGAEHASPFKRPRSRLASAASQTEAQGVDADSTASASASAAKGVSTHPDPKGLVWSSVLPADLPPDMATAAGHLDCYWGDGPLFTPNTFCPAENALTASMLRSKAKYLLPSVGEQVHPSDSAHHAQAAPRNRAPAQGFVAAATGGVDDAPIDHASLAQYEDMMIYASEGAKGELITSDPIAFAMYVTRNSRLLSSLPAYAHAALCKRMTWREVPAGTIIYKQGDRADFYYVILDGSINVYLDRQTPAVRSEHKAAAALKLGKQWLARVKARLAAAKAAPPVAAEKLQPTRPGRMLILPGDASDASMPHPVPPAAGLSPRSAAALFAGTITTPVAHGPARQPVPPLRRFMDEDGPMADVPSTPQRSSRRQRPELSVKTSGHEDAASPDAAGTLGDESTGPAQTSTAAASTARERSIVADKHSGGTAALLPSKQVESQPTPSLSTALRAQTARRDSAARLQAGALAPQDATQVELMLGTQLGTLHVGESFGERALSAAWEQNVQALLRAQALGAEGQASQAGEVLSPTRERAASAASRASAVPSGMTKAMRSLVSTRASDYPHGFFGERAATPLSRSSLAPTPTASATVVANTDGRLSNVGTAASGGASSPRARTRDQKGLWREVTAVAAEDTCLLCLHKDDYVAIMQTLRDSIDSDVCKFLSRVPLLACCTREELAALAKMAVQRRHVSGTPVILQGQRLEGLYLIRSGRCEVQTQQVVTTKTVVYAPRPDSASVAPSLPQNAGGLAPSPLRPGSSTSRTSRPSTAGRRVTSTVVTSRRPSMSKEHTRRYLFDLGIDISHTFHVAPRFVAAKSLATGAPLLPPAQHISSSADTAVQTPSLEHVSARASAPTEVLLLAQPLAPRVPALQLPGSQPHRAPDAADGMRGKLLQRPGSAAPTTARDRTGRDKSATARPTTSHTGRSTVRARYVLDAPTADEAIARRRRMSAATESMFRRASLEGAVDVKAPPIPPAADGKVQSLQSPIPSRPQTIVKAETRTLTLGTLGMYDFFGEVQVLSVPQELTYDPVPALGDGSDSAAGASGMRRRPSSAGGGASAVRPASASSGAIMRSLGAATPLGAVIALKRMMHRRVARRSVSSGTSGGTRADRHETDASSYPGRSSPEPRDNGNGAHTQSARPRGTRVALVAPATVSCESHVDLLIITREALFACTSFASRQAMRDFAIKMTARANVSEAHAEDAQAALAGTTIGPDIEKSALRMRAAPVSSFHAGMGGHSVATAAQRMEWDRYRSRLLAETLVTSERAVHAALQTRGDIIKLRGRTLRIRPGSGATVTATGVMTPGLSPMR